MSMYLVIIRPSDQKIGLVEIYSSYETKDYHCFPDEENEPIQFDDIQDAIDWVKKSIKPELISSSYKHLGFLAIRQEYLL